MSSKLELSEHFKSNPLYNKLREYKLLFKSEVPLTPTIIDNKTPLTTWEYWWCFRSACGGMQLMIQFFDYAQNNPQFDLLTKLGVNVYETIGDASYITFISNLCDDIVTFRNGNSYMRQPEMYVGYDHIFDGQLKYRYKHKIMHMEMKQLQKHWLPYKSGILVVFKNPKLAKHCCVLLMTKREGATKYLNILHGLFHQLFHFDFVKRKHYRICIVCNKKNKKCKGNMRICGHCKQRRYCSKYCQKVDWNRKGHRLLCRNYPINT
eukprot:256511_1